MKATIYKLISRIIIGSLPLALLACQRDISELSPATNPTNAEVFIDAFVPGLNYASFGGAVPDAFQTDTSQKYSGTASMRFAVPDYNDPNGSYVGGSFFLSAPRDLSSYNALTFYIKATQPANIDVIGFGNDFGNNTYQTSISGLPVNTNWKKVIIPIADPSKLTAEKGMFFISEGPENQKGYTFWIDEVKFEKLGTIAFHSATILDGNDKVATSFIGVNNTIDGLAAIYNLPNGVNQSVNVTPYYFDFLSSNSSTATVDIQGNVKTVGSGNAIITATLGGKKIKGSLTINSAGNYIKAPVPTVDPSKVISIFSDAYTNVAVDYYNGYWAPYQTTQSSDFVVNSDHVLNYTNFNFVGIQISNPPINASAMSTVHFDLFFPNAVTAPTLKIQIIDFGADGVSGGTDDKTGVYNVTGSLLESQKWVSLNIPLASFSGLTNKAHIGQIIFEGTNISNFYADNIYLYNDGSIFPVIPSAAAPVPTAAASGVLSIFSDSYTNVAGTNFNPNWGQTTLASQVSIAGNNTLKYAGLNYQGIEFANPLNVGSYRYIHLDYYSANSTSLKFYLISSGPVEKPYTLSAPTGIGPQTNGWKSIDIPLTTFAPVNLASLIQFKIDGNGDVFFDNIYFHN